jgi:D-serine deaminase-like pyridoxal phosphate-dependent protein
MAHTAKGVLLKLFSLPAKNFLHIAAFFSVCQISETFMHITELDTPALLIDRRILLDNLQAMQDYAARQGAALRPHAKTHKMPSIAHMQMAMGAAGIAVAKVGEAEVMFEHGLTDILIANEIVGIQKLMRIRHLAEQGADIVFGVDCPDHIHAAEQIFAQSSCPAKVSIEIEVGENRSGIIRESDFLQLLEMLKQCRHVVFAGLFSHDGNSYFASNKEECHAIALSAMERTVHFARLAEQAGMKPLSVSFGSTPSLMYGFDILPGITELRPGTYALMDASQAHAIQSQKCCAATILATVISKPTPERVILDVGAKGLTMQERSTGICSTPGKGSLLDFPHVYIHDVYDEHAIIYHREFHDAVSVGDKVRIIPVHICPVCNLYDTAYMIEDSHVIEEIPIACRGKML